MWFESDIATEVGALWALDTDRQNEGWQVRIEPDAAQVILTDDDGEQWIVSVRPMPGMWR